MSSVQLVRHTPLRRLLISGIPGCGKWRFVRWLAAHGFDTAVSDDLFSRAGTTLLEVAWRQILPGGDVSVFVQQLTSWSAQVAVEFGFPIHVIHLIEELRDGGMDLWWLDGDRRKALEQWRITRPGQGDDAWQAQVSSLDAERGRIRRLYGDHVVTTLGADGFLLDEAGIWRQMFWDPLPSPRPVDT
jgi:hypothetical protein